MSFRPDATLPQTARLMADRHIKRLPVIDSDGTLKGIASHADLLKVFLRTDEELATDIRLTVVDRLIPFFREAVKVTFTEGIAALTGQVGDSHLIGMAERLTHSVEGVVQVHCRLGAPTSQGAHRDW
ncbi:CBS domain-containing protein [Streptomyces sp. NPDC054904]